MDWLEKQVSVKDIIFFIGLFVWAGIAWSRFERVEADVRFMQSEMASIEELRRVEEETGIAIESIEARQRRWIDRFTAFSEEVNLWRIGHENRLTTLETTP